MFVTRKGVAKLELLFQNPAFCFIEAYWAFNVSWSKSKPALDRHTAIESKYIHLGPCPQNFIFFVP
jgi:hypothetical protein